jgi:hypothetical protein
MGIGKSTKPKYQKRRKRKMRKMRKVVAVFVAAIMVLSLGAGMALAKPEGIGDGIVDGQVLSGQHYNLNIIGVTNPKNANMDSNGGHVIFVDLYGKSKIELVQSGTKDAPGTDADDFAVLDKNGTDKSPAVLALPDPELDPYIVPDEEGEEIAEVTETISAYSIFVRPLGSPQGKPYAKITTCAEVVESNMMKFLDADAIKVLNKAAEFGGVASIESTGQLIREKGKSIFTNQTAALLTIVLKIEIYEWQDVDDDPLTPDVLVLVDTVYVRVPIFDELIQGEYWEYDNNGLKLLQVRIYRVGTDVSTADDPEAWGTLPLP